MRARSRSLTLPTMAALGAVLAVTAGLFATLLPTTRSLDASAKEGGRAAQLQQQASQLERVAVDLETGVRGFLITRDPTYLESYERGRARLGPSVQRLLTLAQPQEHGRLLRLRDSLAAYVHDYTELLVRSAAPSDVALLETTREGKRRLDAIRAQFASLDRQQTGIMEERRERSQALRYRLLALAAVGTLLSAALLILLMLGLNRTILGPVRRAVAAANRVTDVEVLRESDLTPEQHEHALTGAHAVLVVEDNAISQRVIEAMLSKRGFAVACAGDGRECLAMLAAHDYDLVFMDCQMPEMDGYEATAALRAREAGTGAHLPVVAMTAHAVEGDRERCLAAGMDDYLSKPLRQEELEAVLERWLGATSAAREPDASPALVDAARVRVFRDDYPEIVEQLVALFVDSTPPLLRELREGALSGDGEAVTRAAHKLKGSCQNIGAGGMAARAARLERQGTAETAELDELEVTFRATCDALRAALIPAVS